MDNYEVARDRAQAYFLNFDQSALIHCWDLPFDDDYLYVDFINISYRICRSTGRIYRISDGRQAGFSEVLSIFDLLCHNKEKPLLSGRYAPVNSLRGCPPSAGVGTDFHSKTAQYFDSNFHSFCDACYALGGTSVQMADIAFRFPVFAGMDVILKFYRSDEEFPASMTLMWDDNTLDFIFYETVFYIAGFLLSQICQEMKQAEVAGGKDGYS